MKKLKTDFILEVAIQQLRNNFLLTEIEAEEIKKIDKAAYEKTMYSLDKINLKYKNKYYEGELNPFNAVMYCQYLYRLSNEAYKLNLIKIAEKIYYLNKMLNSVELFYAVNLPKIWSCEHPLGSVFGRAQYGDYFFFYQGCTVGGNGGHEGGGY